jgi:hypothetical protein
MHTGDRRFLRGPLNPNWKGGRTLHAPSGYVWVKRPEHPHAMANGCVREHILVVEAAMGKILRADAPVHHVDRNRSHNANTNLVACDSVAYHNLLHKRQRAMDACGDPNARRCSECGKYDRQDEMAFRGKRGAEDRAAHRDCINASVRKFRAGKKRVVDPATGKKTYVSRQPGDRAPRATDAACANGHLWTPETEYRNPTGRRFCRICTQAARERHAQKTNALALA